MRMSEPFGGVKDEDRLPWLETIEPDEADGAPVGRIVLLVLAGLAVLGLVLFGLYMMQQRRGGGDGGLIAAPAGDYKIRPEEPGGLKVEGEGDSAIAASAGSNVNAAIDLSAVPEAPIARVAPTAVPPSRATPGGERSATASVPAAAAPLRAQRPMSAPVTRVPGSASGGALVQLGAFPTEGAANGAWSAIAKRFGYVAPLGKSIQAAEVNGRKVYRLRVNAGSADAAADICARLKVAGESCFVTS